MKLMYVLCLTLLLTGCFSNANYEATGTLVKIAEDTDSSTFVYVGAGIIKITKPSNINVAIIDHKGIGVGAGSHLAASGYIGYDSNSLILIDRNADVLVDLKKWWFYSEYKIEKLPQYEFIPTAVKIP